MSPSRLGKGVPVNVRYLLLSAYNIGGAVRSLTNQANALAAEGHDVELVSVYRHKAQMPFALDPRVSVRVLIDQRARRIRRPVHVVLGRRPSRVVPLEEARYRSFNLATDVVIRRYLGGLRDGVVVTGRPGMNVQLARYGPPGVVKVGEDHLNFRRYRPTVVAAIKEWYPRLDAVAVLTAATAADYRRALGPAVRVERIPNMLPTTERRRSSLDGKVIIAAGRLARQKGFDLLLDAFAPVARDHPDWELRVFGGGKLYDDLARQVAGHGLTDQVRLMGRTTHLDDELAAASIFVLSSRFEGFPMVVLEAMAHGLPVVAFDCHTGPGDILTDGWDGILVPPRDVTALATRIRELVENPARRHELGEHATQTVRTYDSSRVVAQWTSLFTELGAR